MGPTASGKSAIALELAQLLPVEIVSVDSAQVYRGMDIGTAKPDAAARARVAHHLVDLIDPDQSYSAARFRVDALAAIAGIRSRGRIPLLVGGTMLYFKALREGLSRLPQADARLRKELDERAAAAGWPALHAELARVDPATAARLSTTDRQRIQRALEVFHISGTPLSALQGARRSDGAPDFVAIALVPSDRAELHRRIADRFDAMLASGLVEEVRTLRQRFSLTASMPSMRCVGYRQIWDVLEGAQAPGDLRERGIAATRQLAKRQLTWLRSMQAQTLDCLAPGLPRKIAELVDAHLSTSS
ncbi:MAG TPA: tRNA (adenosine(37)-N6)-dimethylallyltransferase MiaA [Casimicrobiaceae bacterium]|nr:tRNA (adenosine(37)-N6)-dimethylallyltransferase MiaA [Casimicrobiaceae bacterium]